MLSALIRREYAISSSVLVNVCDDRMEFPIAGAPGACDDLLSGAFCRLGLAEADGAGIGRIFDGCAKSKASPGIGAADSGFMITLPNMRLADFEDERRHERVAEEIARRDGRALTAQKTGTARGSRTSRPSP
ncbi:MAG: hypothetical protein LBG62_06130 [Candidatus Methanoplasma sp.]|jgi:ATP-dependent DNA helicase RecG|nr:hypothetical protein [Candidatus Methanoplasma sp.]